MLLEIVNYVKAQKTTTFKALAYEFKVNPKALQPILAFLIKKNLITTTVCKTCNSCGYCVSFVYYSAV
jgi:FeoC like transcriptional regulator